MPFRKCIFLLTAGLVVLNQTPSIAAEQTQKECPEKIAVIAANDMALKTSQVLEKVYAVLGCPVELVFLPGRRGLIKFNKGEVHGELFRLKSVEPLMTREFVRSTALFKPVKTLWVHPDEDVRGSYPIGYIVGVVWQERFKTTRQKLAFHSTDKMLDRYNRGTLGGFLQADYVVNSWRAEGKISPSPLALKSTSDGFLYHYLRVEFSAFMERFSQYVEKHRPFRGLGQEKK